MPSSCPPQPQRLIRRRLLNNVILTEYGASLPVKYGEQNGAGIYLVPDAGTDLLGEADAALVVEDGRLLADGRTAWDALRALRALSNTLSDAPAGNFSFAEGYRLEVPRTDNLRIMSYNILLTASSLTARKPLVTRVVAEQLPDSLGLQVVTSGLDFLPQGSPWRGV